MFPSIPLSSLKGFRLLARIQDGEQVVLDLTARRKCAPCTCCGHRSAKHHSTYQRIIADLPLDGMRVRLRVMVRRFFCGNLACPRRIFAEQFPDLVAPFARQSLRSAHALQEIGRAVGGRAGAALAHTLGYQCSMRTVVRLVQARVLPAFPAPRVIGIDEWCATRSRMDSCTAFERRYRTWRSAASTLPG